MQNVKKINPVESVYKKLAEINDLDNEEINVDDIIADLSDDLKLIIKNYLSRTDVVIKIDELYLRYFDKKKGANFYLLVFVLFGLYRFIRILYKSNVLNEIGNKNILILMGLTNALTFVMLKHDSITTMVISILSHLLSFVINLIINELNKRVSHLNSPDKNEMIINLVLFANSITFICFILSKIYGTGYTILNEDIWYRLGTPAKISVIIDLIQNKDEVKSRYKRSLKADKTEFDEFWKCQHDILLKIIKNYKQQKSGGYIEEIPTLDKLLVLSKPDLSNSNFILILCVLVIIVLIILIYMTKKSSSQSINNSDHLLIKYPGF